MDFIIVACLGLIFLINLIILLRTLIKSSSENEIKSLINRFNLLENSFKHSETVSREEFGRSRSELAGSFTNFQGIFDQRLNTIDVRINNSAKENRTELTNALKSFEEQFGMSVKGFNEIQQQKFTELIQKQNELTKNTETKLEKLRETIESRLMAIQNDNNIKLEKMRETVDEKLHKTLEERLTQSFESVTKHLMDVQKGLSEMKTLADDVGGLKKVLTNVKQRGVLGEAQLGALLDQFLTKEQFDINVRVKPKSKENVEYAVKLPGTEENGHIWLPIDSKFPIENYSRLNDAYSQGEKSEIEKCAKALEQDFIKEAREIKEKYIEPPYTTDFGLMFLPFESLYAEALRLNLFEKIQKEFKVTIVGPTTLTAFLNSLQVGFKTLAISKQSSEVWRVLGAVKSEFGKFGDSLEAVQKNLDSASNKLTEVTNRSKQMEKKLDKVTTMPSEEAVKLIEDQ